MFMVCSFLENLYLVDGTPHLWNDHIHVHSFPWSLPPVCGGRAGAQTPTYNPTVLTSGGMPLLLFPILRLLSSESSRWRPFPPKQLSNGLSVTKTLKESGVICQARYLTSVPDLGILPVLRTVSAALGWKGKRLSKWMECELIFLNRGNSVFQKHALNWVHPRHAVNNSLSLTRPCLVTVSSYIIAKCKIGYCLTETAVSGYK